MIVLNKLYSSGGSSSSSSNRRIEWCIGGWWKLIGIFLFVVQSSLSEADSKVTPRSDISDCSELEITGSRIAPSLNGRYQRLDELNEGLPTFSGFSEGKQRYIWWNSFDDFSRWSIGTVKYSRSIEAFMDLHRTDEAWLLGRGRDWHVVSNGAWTEDKDLYVECVKKESGLQAPIQSSRSKTNNNNKNEMVPPQSKSQNDADARQQPPQQQYQQQQYQQQAPPQQQQQQQQQYQQPPRQQQYDNFNKEETKEAIIVSGARNNHLNGLYNRIEDSKGYPCYQHEHTARFIFRWNQQDRNQWYISAHLDTDRRVEAYLSQRSRSVVEDSQDGGWYEFQNGQWQLNNNLRAQLSTPDQRNSQQEAEEALARDQAEQRRKEMFRRVNKLDQPVEMEGNYESNVPTSGISDVVLVGSDNDEVNGYYAVVNIKYNGRYVYRSASQSYLFYVKYKGGEMARWQVGPPQSGLQNDQPIAIVNSDAETPEQIPTWVSWIVYDEEKNEWFRQPRINTYKADCTIELSNAKHTQLNGRYAITPQTYNNRPVFERSKPVGSGEPNIVIYMDDKNGQVRWYMSRPDGQIGDLSVAWAFIQSAALTPDGATEFESWYEWEDSQRDFVENGQMILQGTCSKVKEHDWRRRRQRREEKRKMETERAAANKRCPGNIEIETDPGENSAVVHWATSGEASENEDEFDVVYDEGSLAPGSKFPIGRTAVTYSLKRGNDEIAKCDFIVFVKDVEPPVIDCPGDIYSMTIFNSNKGIARWADPYVKDNSDLPVTLEQIRGPAKGSELTVGRYEIEYKATDYFGNTANCVFNLIVADRQAPRIYHCPANTKVEVFEDTEWSAWPEWGIPTAEDAVDGVVPVKQVAGVQSGTRITLPPGANNYIEKIVYEAVDNSGNAARCTFRVELVRNEDHSRKHAAMHEKLSEQPDLTDSEAQKLQEQELKHHSSEKWHEAAGDIKQAQEIKHERKRRRMEENFLQRGGRKSSVHESKTMNKDETRASEELRSNKQNRRERRKRERGVGEVLWIVITPWNWPWALFIPMFIIFIIGCGIGIYFLVEEMTKPRGRRVPDQDSLWYKITHWNTDGRKRMKDRV